MGECLICLGTTRKPWSPETPCDCRVNVHKICWERWAERSYEACIICKASKYRPMRPEPPPAAQPETETPTTPGTFWALPETDEPTKDKQGDDSVPKSDRK